MEVLMKLLLIVSLFSLSFSIFAQTDAKFEEQKKMVLENISARLAAIQTEKACLEAAANPEGFKKCHEAAKLEHKKLESQRIDKGIKRLEDKKKELEGKK
jgi:hypothetical protein